MDRYRKLKLSIFFLLTISNLTYSQITSDSIFCYLVNECSKKMKNCNQTKLIVRNESSKDICIEGFNKSIVQLGSFYPGRKPSAFYWDIQTLSEKEPEDVGYISDYGGVKRLKKGKLVLVDQNTNLVIPKKSTFVSDVYMERDGHRFYPEGYYKLLLIHSETKKCIATSIIKF